MLRQLLFLFLSFHTSKGFHLPIPNSVIGRSCLTNNYISTPSNLDSYEGRGKLCKLPLSFDDTNDKTNNGLITSQQDDIKETISTPLDRPVLAMLDFFSLVAFAAVGKASHSADGSLDIGAVLTTAFPFLVSWFVTSPFTGVYSDSYSNGQDSSNEFLDTAKGTLNGWAVAVPLGIAGRGLIKGYIPPLPFVIVTLISTLAILTIVRLLYTAVEANLTQRT